MTREAFRILPRPAGRMWAFIACVGLIAGAVWSSAQGAQGPERTVKVPGLDLSLKDGWQVLVHQGCRFAVPVSWHADADGSLATAADGSNISIRMFRITNWAAHKAQIKAAFGRVKVMHDDSDRRLWSEVDDKARVQHYVDVLDGLSMCSALLEIRTATTPDAEDTTKRIVESVGPAPEKWPPDTLKYP